MPRLNPGVNLDWDGPRTASSDWSNPTGDGNVTNHVDSSEAHFSQRGVRRLTPSQFDSQRIQTTCSLLDDQILAVICCLMATYERASACHGTWLREANLMQWMLPRYLTFVVRWV